MKESLPFYSSHCIYTDCVRIVALSVYWNRFCEREKVHKNVYVFGLQLDKHIRTKKDFTMEDSSV